MSAKSKWEWNSIKKTRQMAEVFKRKSGPINKKPTRAKEKEKLRREIEQELEE